MRPEAEVTVQDVLLDAFGYACRACVFRIRPSKTEIVALVFGSPGGQQGLLRIQSSCLPSEVFGSTRCDCAWQLRHAVELIARSGCGAIVYLPGQDARGAGITTLFGSYELMDHGMTSAEAFSAMGERRERRDFSDAVAVVRRLGIDRAALITNNPDKVEALRRGGIDVPTRIPSIMPTDDVRARAYLDSKFKDFGHLMGREPQ